MDLAEINSTLADAENIPVLGGIVRELRECVQIMTETPVNADVFDHQADNLERLRNEGTSLAHELDSIITQLSADASWQGQAADEYLGPGGGRGSQNGGGGASGQMNRYLHQTLGTFAANSIAHHKSADFCRKVNALQVALWGEVVVAVVGVGVIVAATASVIFSETDLATVPAVAADSAVAAGTAGTIGTLTATGGELTGELAAVVAEAEASLSASYATAAAMTTIKIAATALCLDIGLAIFEGAWADSNDITAPTPLGAGKDSNKMPLPPQRVYPPNIKSDLQKATYDYLMMNYGADVANEYASSLIIPDEVDLARLNEYYAYLKKWPSVPPIDIVAMMKANLTSAQMESLIQRYRSDGSHTQLDILAQRPDATFILQQLVKYVHEPYYSLFGIDQVVADLVNGSRTSYNGAVYQLKVMNYVGPENISHVEPYVPRLDDPGLARGPDIVLKNGTVIQCKSYDWCKYSHEPYLSWMISKLKKNIADDEGRYAGNIEYYFDTSSPCSMPDGVKDVFKGRLSYQNWP